MAQLNVFNLKDRHNRYIYNAAAAAAADDDNNNNIIIRMMMILMMMILMMVMCIRSLSHLTVG